MENMLEKCVCIFSTRLSIATKASHINKINTKKRNAWKKTQSLHWEVKILLFSLPPTLSISWCLCLMYVTIMEGLPVCDHVEHMLTKCGHRRACQTVCSILIIIAYSECNWCQTEANLLSSFTYLYDEFQRHLLHSTLRILTTYYISKF